MRVLLLLVCHFVFRIHLYISISLDVLDSSHPSWVGVEENTYCILTWFLERDPALRLTGASVDIRNAGVDIIKKMGTEQIIRDNCTEEAGMSYVTLLYHRSRLFCLLEKKLNI